MNKISGTSVTTKWVNHVPNNSGNNICHNQNLIKSNISQIYYTHTSKDLGVFAGITFSHTPDEAVLG